jgi:glycine cleavage system aminomethyltransferase T
VNLDFLKVHATEDVVARSPMQASARAAGARFELRDGWNVAVAYGTGGEAEAQSARRCAGWADVSHLRKLELQGPAEALDGLAGQAGAELSLGEAVRAGSAWWCRLTRTRALVIGAAGEVQHGDVHVADLTTTFAALTLVGPLAREVFARFCALDLRPQVTPVGAFRPGSIARQPGILIREGEERYLFLFGWATGEYMWSIVSDAGEHLGGRPIGVDALAQMPLGQEAARA